MTQIPLGIGAYSRPYGLLPEIRCENRFFEQNPVGAEKVALLSRPGSKLFLQVGTGPIRTLFSQAGVFDEDLFIVSGTSLYRYDGTTVTNITGTVANGLPYPVMTALAIPDWQVVFITDGLTLQYYEGEAHAVGTFDVVAIVDNDVVRIGSVYYKFTTADVNIPAGFGTVGDPWKVKLGATNEESMTNLFNAINASGIAGTDYSQTLAEHPDVRAFEFGDATVGLYFNVRAKVPGTAGNAIVTTETGANLSWTQGGTLTGGGGHALKPVVVPTGVLISDLATLASHVVCVQSNSQRFYWIRPGEVRIDELDFSSAESEPDYIVNVAAIGDMLWFFGQSSTESWYASGDSDQPFLRTQGRAFSQGIIPGTFAKINETIVVVGRDRIVYRIAGVPERISHHGIEERIRVWQEGLTP